MSSLWTELLFLHGYITDPRLAHRLTAPLPPSKPAPPATPLLARLKRRLCLGIGDGVVRTQ